jgi:hypothetical protein
MLPGMIGTEKREIRTTFAFSPGLNADLLIEEGVETRLLKEAPPKP